MDAYPYLSGVNYESMVDGEGVRATIYLSGCSHNCPGCHNPETHNPLFGTKITKEVINEMADEISSRPFLSGITLSGGDPFYNPEKTLLFIVHLLFELHNRTGRIPNLWVYTGFSFADLLLSSNPAIEEFLMITDVIVDGPFDPILADKSLSFRGSSNQRIIDVQKSLQLGEFILYSQKEKEK